ncbi:UxaA family hydrolase (plasmid) [Bacillus sp. F19]|nr:UxaA family hydrolase [Bacillus sp. F19]
MEEYSFEAGVHCIVMDAKDNVATLLRDVKAGEKISYSVNGVQSTLTFLQDVKSGHKAALCQILKGEHVIKYGESIGAATEFIDEGEHVHIHNIEGIRGRGDRKTEQEVKSK